jgi:hypothetical protein
MTGPSTLRHGIRILLMGMGLGLVLYAVHIAAGMFA